MKRPKMPILVESVEPTMMGQCDTDCFMTDVDNDNSELNPEKPIVGVNQAQFLKLFLDVVTCQLGFWDYWSRLTFRVNLQNLAVSSK